MASDGDLLQWMQNRLKCLCEKDISDATMSDEAALVELFKERKRLLCFSPLQLRDLMIKHADIVDAKDYCDQVDHGPRIGIEYATRDSFLDWPNDTYIRNITVGYYLANLSGSLGRPELSVKLATTIGCRYYARYLWERKSNGYVSDNPHNFDYFDRLVLDQTLQLAKTGPQLDRVLKYMLAEIVFHTNASKVYKNDRRYISNATSQSWSKTPRAGQEDHNIDKAERIRMANEIFPATFQYLEAQRAKPYADMVVLKVAGDKLPPEMVEEICEGFYDKQAILKAEGKKMKKTSKGGE